MNTPVMPCADKPRTNPITLSVSFTDKWFVGSSRISTFDLKCIARAIALDPEVILMDEPASALDPIATSKIEELIAVLTEKFTVVIVTHSMQQAARISDYTAFFHLGEIVEVGATNQIFTHPKEKRTEDYITGRFG